MGHFTYLSNNFQTLFKYIPSYLLLCKSNLEPLLIVGFFEQQRLWCCFLFFSLSYFAKYNTQLCVRCEKCSLGVYYAPRLLTKLS